MKRFFFIMSLAFLGVFAQQQTFAQDADGMATIYFYREGQFGAALQNYNVFVNGEKVCKISNNRYFFTKVKPGEVYFTSKAGGVEVFKRKENFSMEVKAGETYYISCDIKRSLTRYRLEFEEVTENTAKNAMKDMEEDNCMQEE